MSLSVAMLRAMRDKGLSFDDAIELAELWETEEKPKRSSNAERQARFRAKRNASNVTDNVTSNATPTPETKVSPTPPSKTQTLTPYSPPKSADLAEQIWSLQPKLHRRSTRPDVREAVAAAIKRGAEPEQLLEACRAYYRQPDCVADEGKFAKGAHRIITADRWRDFLPSPEPPPQPATPAVIADRLRHYRDTGDWRPSWGPKPSELAA